MDANEVLTLTCQRLKEEAGRPQDFSYSDLAAVKEAQAGEVRGEESGRKTSNEPMTEPWRDWRSVCPGSVLQSFREALSCQRCIKNGLAGAEREEYFSMHGRCTRTCRPGRVVFQSHGCCRVAVDPAVREIQHCKRYGGLVRKHL